MMKRYAKRIAPMIACIIVTASLLAPVAVADDEDKTEANIEFTEGNGPTTPVDPEEPEKPLDPEPPAVGGSLVIIYTTPWDFGEIELDPTGFYDMKTTRPNVQLVDLRGNSAGWTLQVSVSKFEDDQGAESLEGSRIHINGGFPNTNGNINAAPEVYNPTVFNVGDTRNVAFADTNKGMGLWVIRWYDTTTYKPTIQLEVPATSVKLGKHKATVHWSFNATP